VNLWIYRTQATDRAIEDMLNELKQKWNPRMAPILLREIAELPIVQGHSRVLWFDLQGQGKGFPVRWQTDLVCVIAAYHTLMEGETKQFVCTDFLVEPQDQSDLFDKQTVQNLEKFGVVMAYGSTESGKDVRGSFGFENTFYIMTARPEVFEAIKMAIIDLSLARAGSLIGVVRSSKKFPGLPEICTHLKDAIEICFCDMFVCLFFLEAKKAKKHVALKFKSDNKLWESNDLPVAENFQLVMNDKFVFRPELTLEGKDASDYLPRDVNPNVHIYPTKKVKHPLHVISTSR